MMSFKLVACLSLFISAAAIASPNEGKIESRRAIVKASEINQFATAVEPLDYLIDSREQVFADGKILRRPAEIDVRGFQSAWLTNDVWSSYAWPLYSGHTALRYGVAPGAAVKDFKEAWASVNAEGKTYAEIARNSGSLTVDDLSPAEKYDLLFSDPKKFPRGVLTKVDWQKGLTRQRERGHVYQWPGYCHGWAPASFMVKRPINAIELIAADGVTKIKFYPEDIKALAASLWANALPRTRLIGTRCGLSEPSTDQAGRVKNKDCWGVTPSILHLAVVNRIAGARKNLILDSFYDVQVWNYPIVGYQYRYFNPLTGVHTNNLDEAKVAKSAYTNDPFAKWRSKDAKEIVGVVLDLDYVIGRPPIRQAVDSKADDVIYRNVYAYDLELDANGNAIGGEWHQVHRPDFLWLIPQDSKPPTTRFEAQALGVWDRTKPMPESWKLAALRAAKEGKPLAKIVDALVEMSQ